ncbi:Reducing polyketide synthase hmp8 [Paramyrothecium foliicola]|nr:Reducing polyketide synthase hmp8 [Paramyrothecium foliicola]
MLFRALPHEEVLKLHDKYGDIVRLAPDELSFLAPESWKEIMGHRQQGQKENGKDPNYAPPATQDIIGANRVDHTRMRKALSHGFSQQAMLNQQPLIKGYIDLFMRRLKENSSDGTKSVDMTAWYNYCTFDLIGDLAFGESFGCRFQVLHLAKEGLPKAPDLVMRILSKSDVSCDNEFREKGGFLEVPRVYKSLESDDRIRQNLEDTTMVTSLNGDGANYRLTIRSPGLLDSLHFVREEIEFASPLADNDLELDVKSTGLNFRDVMASMGLLPTTKLGQEVSGVVLRAGGQASSFFKPGDRVCALSVRGAHATTARCDYRVTSEIPDTMSFGEAASVPMVFTAAYHALVNLAGLKPGQSVLVHAAAGGLGQAAIQLANYLDLTIYATAGSEDKRRFITEHFGVTEEHVFNSRDASFAKGVHRVTGGRGVDCVLNSLSGELLQASWTCVASFGSFVEVGLRDVSEDFRLDMRPIRRSITFNRLDMQTIIETNPTSISEALREVFRLFSEGFLRVPSPLTQYPIGQVEQAFRTMQQGKHRGKIVFSFREEDKASATVLQKAEDGFKLDPKGTYLFIGGLGGLCRSLARQFVLSGARHLAFLSRSGTTNPQAKVLVHELKALGAQVMVFPCDVSDQRSFLAAMGHCTQQLPPIKGVLQMAVVLRDALIEKMTYEDWILPLQPKVQGTWNVHEYFGPRRPLNFMIFCSSISGLCGNSGQAQYAAGNSYQDALSHYRREEGLKAVSVNLGIMLSVGVLAEMNQHNYKPWEEVLGIREPSFHAVMKSLINAQQNCDRSGNYPTQICLGLGNSDLITAHCLPNPSWFADPRFRSLTVGTASTLIVGGLKNSNLSTGPPLTSKLSEAANKGDGVEFVHIITQALIAKVADILRLPISEVNPNRPLYKYGVDSLVALEVRNWVTREMKASVALLDILAAIPMRELAAKIAQKSNIVVA